MIAPSPLKTASGLCDRALRERPAATKFVLHELTRYLLLPSTQFRILFTAAAGNHAHLLRTPRPEGDVPPVVVVAVFSYYYIDWLVYGTPTMIITMARRLNRKALNRQKPTATKLQSPNAPSSGSEPAKARPCSTLNLPFKHPHRVAVQTPLSGAPAAADGEHASLLDRGRTRA